MNEKSGHFPAELVAKTSFFWRDTGTVSAVSWARQKDLCFNEKGGQFSVLSVATKQDVFDQKSELFPAMLLTPKQDIFDGMWRHFPTLLVVTKNNIF